MSENPYQAPDTFEAPPAHLPDTFAQDPLAIRQEHIKHETSVRAAGILYYLGTIAIAVRAIFSLLAIGEGGNMGEIATTAATGILLAALAVVQFIGARYILKLKPAGRVIGIVISTIALLRFPLGTLIHGYILYLLLCKKGRMIFSPEYAEIVAATPDVKYKTSWILRGILIIFLILFVIGMFVDTSPP